MNVSNKMILGVSVLAAGLMISAVSKAADGDFAKNHPRREKVLKKDRKLKGETNAAEASGAITEKQANKLKRQENGVRREEQRQAARNGGHITEAEKNRDTRQENRIGGELKHDEAKDAAAGTAPAAGAGGGAAGAPTGN